jgi:hypothetical protein
MGPSLYGLNLARKLFTEEQLAAFRLSPTKTSIGARPIFPVELSEKVSALKGTQFIR